MAHVSIIAVCEPCFIHTSLHPSELFDIGTPVCPECDEDMTYERTEVK